MALRLTLPCLVREWGYADALDVVRLSKSLVALAVLSAARSRVDRLDSSSIVALADLEAVVLKLVLVLMACGSLKAFYHDEIAGLASNVDCARLLAAAVAVFA